ncbi:MAG: cyclic nucleotide-binding domain-containing protein, partial [Myxococcota bacterium]
RLQRTLLEMGFVPAAFVPAMVFDRVERLDVVKFVHATVPMESGPLDLLPESRAIANHVLARLTNRAVLPEIEARLGDVTLFAGLTTEQARRVASHCGVREFPTGHRLWGPGDPSPELLVPLNGRCTVHREGQEVGYVAPGEAIGEIAMLLERPHSAAVVVDETTTMAVLTKSELDLLSAQRPDIALQLYRNLARGLGRKLGRR